MSVNFYLSGHPGKEGEQQIRISANIKKTRLMSTIGISVKETNWNKESQTVKLKTKNAKGESSNIINGKLASIRNHFEEYEKEVKQKPTKEDLHHQLSIALGEITDSSSENVLFYFDEFVQKESIANQWTPGTMECWNAFRKHLAAQGKGLMFDHFNDDGIQSFVNYLRTKAKMEEKTVQKHYLNLRWFLNWAVRNRIAKESEIGNVRPKFKVLQKPVIFLTKEELLKLYSYKIPANGTIIKLHDYEGNEYEKTVCDAGALAKTRDLFCFCAFTGLRYSDMAALKRTDISGDYIYITTQKTNDRLPINLNSFAKEILEKYSDQRFPKGLALPVISNQKMNVYLKDLCELCEINEPITNVCVKAGRREESTQPKHELIGTHAGRRTFICFALSSGIPPQVVMKWTGHKDYKAMRPYIDIAEKTKAEAMNVFEAGLRK